MQRSSFRFLPWTRLQGVVVLTMLSVGVATHANEQNYEIQVDGMVCAFCAYTVSKNLATLPGVIADSVQIDLKRGIANLRSTRMLDEALIEKTFLDSGFTVTAVSAVTEVNAVRIPRTQVAKVILEVNQIGSNLANQLLEALGERAATKTSEFRVVAPQALESEILKPLIMGRQRAIKVHYDFVDQDAAEVTLYQ